MMLTTDGIGAERGWGNSGGCSGDCALPQNPASPKVKTPASCPTSQYPRPGVAAMPTIGLFSTRLPVEPKKRASPKAKMPPSEATSQYPPPSDVAAMPTIGLLSVMLPVEPKNCASP